jgi:N,N-dimethylformamidase
MAKEDSVPPFLAYIDPLSVAPGMTLTVRAAERSGRPKADATLVRVICADTRASGAGFAVEPVAWKKEDRRRSEAHNLPWESACQPGSCAVTPDLPATLDAWTVSCLFMPTLHSADTYQTLLAVGDLRVTIRDGHLYVRHALDRPYLPDGWTEIRTVDQLLGRPIGQPVRVTLHRWHWLSVACAGTSATVCVRTLARGPGEPSTVFSEAVDTRKPLALSGAAHLAASVAYFDKYYKHTQFGYFFNGRIELPWIANVRLEPSEAEAMAERPDALGADPRVVAAWDFSREITSDHAIDVSANRLHGTFLNTPTRAVRGARWDGSVQDWTKGAAHYAAVHFHEDDLTDANLMPLFDWTVPADLASGIYAVKLADGDQEEYVPFFVRPAPAGRRAKVALLIPTATYLAYANTRFPMYAAEVHGTPMSRKDACLRDHPEVGWSLYERHADGSGVHYSSRLRPILNMKPCDDAWAFTADTNITAWLHHLGVPFDVITDEDLHREGADLLAHYDVVITGTHPEYASTPMLDGLEQYLVRGGRLMYMGGNGFYWRVAFHPDNPAIIELRRSEGRGLAWDSQPGEYYHSFTGEYGGLWRNLGRPPNRLVGVGFVALAGQVGTYYRRQPGADDPRANFVFQGTTEGADFGAYGSLGDGAASQEIDRCNVLRESPRHTLVLASSVEHPPDFVLATEEAIAPYAPDDRPKLRADMTLFETPAGGAVFATGSIGFCGALAHNSYENDVCRIATNVLTRFLDPSPLPFPTAG